MVEKGTGVSYGHKYNRKTIMKKLQLFQLDMQMDLVVIGNNCYVEVNGGKYPVVGSVCMDQTMIRLDISREFGH